MYTLINMNSSDKQDLLYNMLDSLKIMAREIPQKYQVRVPYDVLSSLAQLLLDNTVFEIVKELIELQYMTEKHLYNQRQEIINRHKCERENLNKSHKQEVLNAECQGRTHVLQRLPLLHKDQLQKMDSKQSIETLQFDKRILEVLDEKVEEQQSTLEQVGLPGFKVTNNAIDIKVQSYILEFILKLGNIRSN